MDDLLHSDVGISDTTLQEQAKVNSVCPQTEKIDRFQEKFKNDYSRLLSLLNSEEEEEAKRACSDLSYRVFIPWLNKQNQANKFYFAKRGGVSRCVRLMRESIDEQLRCSAGTAIWNFAELGPMYDILWKEGALVALLEFLDSTPQFQRVAVGALFGLLDYIYFKTHLNIEIVSKILSVHVEPSDWALSLGKAGCLVCLSKNAETREELIRLGAHKYLNEEKNNDFLNYLSRIALAHICVEQHDLISDEDRLSILTNIESQFNFSPFSVRLKERECGVVWKSTKHFKHILTSKEPILRKFALFCLANLSYGDYNRSMFSQSMKGYLMCSRWESGEEGNEYFDIIFSNFVESPVFPSLYTICKFKLALSDQDDEDDVW